MQQYYPFIILAFFCLPIHAQPPGSCAVHLGKSFYVTGEVMWFKIYLPPQTPEKTFIIRVALLDKNGTVSDDFFVSTAGKTYAQGYYKIPFHWASGVYQLVFAAQEQRTKRTVVLAKTNVPIYNDLEKPDVINTVLFSDSIKKTSIANNLQINIRLDQAAYRRREPVQAIIEVKNAQGEPVQANLSVAVTDWALTGDPVWQQPNLHPGFTVANDTFENHIFLQMKHLGSAGQPQPQKLVGIYVAQDWRMDYASTNADGLFFVKMRPFYTQKTLQILGYPDATLSAALDDPLRGAPAPPLVYPQGILQYLELSRQRKKILQYYNTLEFDLPYDAVEQAPRTLVPDRILQIADYELFENIATFFREVVTPLSFKFDKKQNRYFARVYNPGTQDYYTGDPLFIIDGKATRNADFIANLTMDQIEAIHLYYIFDKLYNNFQIIGNSGVVHLITKSELALPSEIAPNVFKINGLQLSSRFPEFDPAQQPFFRPQLYWNPTLDTSEKGEASFRFIQSDDRSTFRIQIVAQTPTGQLGYHHQFYTVTN